MACRRCGNCCREYAIAMSFNEDYARFLAYHNLTMRERPDGHMEVYGQAKCVHLRSCGEGFKCGIYESRPTICREWECEKCK